MDELISMVMPLLVSFITRRSGGLPSTALACLHFYLFNIALPLLSSSQRLRLTWLPALICLPLAAWGLVLSATPSATASIAASV